MSTMHVSPRFDEPFFTGTAPSLPNVPFQWDCALNGRGYMIDQSGQNVEQSVSIQAQQFAANADEPGEAILNPEAAWRRAVSSWHRGAGQTHYDNRDSDPHRFRSSKGINPWVRGTLSLLEDTRQVHAAAGTNVRVVTAGGHVYYADGTSVYRTDLTTAAAVTGLGGVNQISSLASIGGSVFAADGAGVYKIDGTTGSSWSTTDCDVIGWAKNRLIGGKGNVLTDHSATGAGVTMLTHGDAAFEWTCIADGLGHVYAAGNSGDVALIYRTAVKPDGTALDAPSVAGRLPHGETIHAMFGYAGILLLGTSRGVRAAQEGSSGDLTIGPVIDVGAAVHAFAAYGQYVWFGWTGYDEAATGLGRIDLTQAIDTLVFAHASDLMCAASGAVKGLAIYGGDPIIGIDGNGVWAPTGGLVQQGTLESGLINLNIVDDKIITGVRTNATGGGAVRVQVAVDGGAFNDIPPSGVARRGAVFETRITLRRGS